jgi:hypothetical protein
VTLFPFVLLKPSFSILSKLFGGSYDARGAPPTDVALILALFGVALSFLPLAAPNI